jgi:hypothetical protein
MRHNYADLEWLQRKIEISSHLGLFCSEPTPVALQDLAKNRIFRSHLLGWFIYGLW